MIFSFSDAQGKVLFKNSRFAVVDIEPQNWTSAAQFKKLGAGKAPRQELFGPRFPSKAFVFEDCASLSLNELLEIDQESIVSGSNSLQRLVLSLKLMKGKNENVNIESACSCFIKKNDKEYRLAEQPNFVYRIETSNDSVSITHINKLQEPNLICFINEWEKIFVPLDEDEELFNKKLESIHARSKLSGRISSEYTIFPFFSTNPKEERRPEIHFRSLKNMKIDEMLDLFSHHKRSGTKLETLTDCFRNLYKRYIGDEVIHESGLLVFRASQNSKSPYKFMPPDWVFCRLSHIKPVYTSPNATWGLQFMLVKSSVEETDALAQVVYSSLESLDSYNELSINFLEEEVIDSMIEQMRKNINKETA